MAFGLYFSCFSHCVAVSSRYFIRLCAAASHDASVTQDCDCFKFSLFILWCAPSTDIYEIFGSFSSALMIIVGTMAATLIGEEARNDWLALHSGH